MCIAALAACAAINACATAAKATKPVPPAKIVLAEEPLQVTQPSADALYRSTDAVAHVKIVSSHPTLVPGRGPMPSVFTVLEANVLDAPKGTLPAHIRIYRVEGLEPVKADDEYLLFLNWNEFLGAYVVAGAEGAYEVNAGGNLRALGRSTAAAEVGHRTLNTVKNDVRVANTESGVKK